MRAPGFLTSRRSPRSPAMTTRLSLLLLFAFGLAAVTIASSCGATRCGPGLCAGCCDSSGACVGGTSTAACGTNGVACSACMGTCNAGTCSAADAGSGGGAGGGAADAGACANCNTGCCQAGVCRGGAAVTACGSAGATCADCLTQNKVCVAGQCQTQCGPSNCANGCCQNNLCVSMTSVMACGTGGEACVRCQAMETCQSGVCTAPGDAGVNPDGGSNCAATCTGCCDTGGTCRAGTNAAACGNMGLTCLVCATCQPLATSGGGRCL